MAEIGLDFDTTDTVEEYDVTFAVQYWSAIDSGDPFTSSTARNASSNLNAISTWYVLVTTFEGTWFGSPFFVSK